MKNLEISNIDKERFLLARKRIETHIVKTPCIESASIGREVGAGVFLKLENRQTTGSFKIRGVTNKILSLNENQSKKLLVAASTGNHGAAFVHTIEKFNLNGRLFLPENITPVKLEAIREYGVPLEFNGTDCVDTELAAQDLVKREGAIFIGPYNDWEVVFGQGTIAVELVEQLGSLDAVLVPVGGGGLASGIAAYLKSVSPKTEVIGCQPKNAAVMYKSIKAGEIITQEVLPSLSDATGGGIEPDSITFDLCREHVDDFILLTEDEILNAIGLVFQLEGEKIEGAAALSVAALCKHKKRFAGKNVALIISGGRVDDSILEKIGKRDD